MMGRRKTVVPPHGRKVRRKVRSRARRYLVVCGGEVTERAYFNRIGSRRNDVSIQVRTKVCSPSQLAELAARYMADDRRDETADSYAEVFVVVDVDDFRDHGQAQAICDKHGMRLIISNPCFEVWLIDHVRQCPAGYTTTAMVERYAKDLHVTNGPRNKYIDFGRIDGHVEDAMSNARRHNTQERSGGRRNLVPGKAGAYAPWTDMPQAMSELGY